MRKDQIIWAAGIKAMSKVLRTEVDKLRVIRSQAYGMMRNSTGDDHAIATSKVIQIDKEINDWIEAYKKVTVVYDFT